MNIPPSLAALLIQSASFLIVSGLLSPVMEIAGFSPSLLVLAIIQGGLAAIFSYWLKADNWWMPIHIGFMPALVLASQLSVDPLWFLAGFVVLLLVFWNTFKTQVPLYLSNEAASLEIEKRLPAGPFRFADIGSGLGDMLLFLAGKRPEGVFFGIESAPLPYCLSRMRLRGRKNCRIQWGDYGKLDLSAYDFVYAFLSPAAMPSLWEKARIEMRKGAVLASNSFPVPDVDPSEVSALPDGKRIYFYRL